MTETVLVTGAGYIGSVLVPELLREGYKVRVLSRFSRAPSLLAVCGDPNLEVLRGDARDQATLRTALGGVDWVLPAAGLVGAPACARDSGEAWAVNYHAVRLLTELAGTRGVVLPNTNSGYGTTPAGSVCTEDTPLKPISVYGQSKQAAEEVVLGAGGVSLRLATAYGSSPRMRLDLLVNDFTYRAVRDGHVVLYEPHFRRNYVHVKDIARAFVFALKLLAHGGGRGQAFNVGRTHLTKGELCRQIRQIVPDFYAIEAAGKTDPDKRDYEVSTERIGLAGFRETVTLPAGIRELVKAYNTMPPGEYRNA